MIFDKKINDLFNQKKLNVLVWGSRARDHAIAQRISESKMLNKLYLAKPNDGFKHLGTVLQEDGFEIVKKAKELDIDLLVVGPEDAQKAGIVDGFKYYNIKSIGTNKKWSTLEGSKVFSKLFMKKYSIPTPNYKVIETKEEFEEAIKLFTFPVVIKSEKAISTSGTSVLIAHTYNEAKSFAKYILNYKEIEYPNRVIIEEYIDGEELSLITLWDGKTLLPLPCVKDYKKLLKNNKGSNTGGMGAICPVEVSSYRQKQIDKYLKTLKNALKREKANFTGVLYSGLIFDKTDMYVLEYNIRFGDPEGQVLIDRMNSDLLEVFYMMSIQKLSKVKLDWKKGTTAAVVVTCDKYPYNYHYGSEIKVPPIENDIKIYYSGVEEKNNKLISKGGRIVTVCKTGENPLKDIYDFINKIEYKHKSYREDIGS